MLKDSVICFLWLWKSLLTFFVKKQNTLIYTYIFLWQTIGEKLGVDLDHVDIVQPSGNSPDLGSGIVNSS